MRRVSKSDKESKERKKMFRSWLKWNAKDFGMTQEEFFIEVLGLEGSMDDVEYLGGGDDLEELKKRVEVSFPLLKEKSRV